ncbi:MAG: hypothetical protein ACT4P2_16070 [Pseudomonadota bacterium]
MLIANLVAGIIGIVLVVAFLGTLMVWLKSVPLIIIMLGVIALMIYDFAKTLKEGNGTPGG